jgi:hypothetical protein
MDEEPDQNENEFDTLMREQPLAFPDDSDEIHFRFGLALRPWDPQKRALEGDLARTGLQKENSLVSSKISL